MKKLFFLLLLTTVYVVSTQAAEAQVNDSIYGFTTERASYRGGEAAMLKQLAEHLDLPSGVTNDFTGRTMIKAVVEKNGTLSTMSIAKSCGRADVDSAVLKAAAYLSDYAPAKNDGEIVRSYTYIPASFPSMLAIRSKMVIKDMDPAPVSQPAPQPEQENKEEDVVYVVVEKMPEFPGGQRALFKYLAETVKYPILAQENKIQGTVMVSFVINKDGSIVDVEVAKSGGDASLDKEAVRVIKSMPKWIPGKNKGKLVRVKYTLPVNFRLQ